MTRLMTYCLTAALLCLLPLTASAADKDNTPAPGDYLCKMEKGYKFRPCQVIEKAGVRTLVFSHEQALIQVEAELRPADKGAVYFNGTMSSARPFPCFRCQERCTTNPESCGCTETTTEQQTQCKAQRLVSLLKRSGKTWSGTYPVKIYYGVGKNGKEWVEVDVYRLTIKKK